MAVKLRKLKKPLPVMKSRCATCPFNPDGNRDLANRVLARTLFRASQLCHHPVLLGKKKETHICRGQRDEQLQLLFRMKIIEAPTDEAFEKASAKYLGR